MVIEVRAVVIGPSPALAGGSQIVAAVQTDVGVVGQVQEGPAIRGIAVHVPKRGALIGCGNGGELAADGNSLGPHVVAAAHRSVAYSIIADDHQILFPRGRRGNQLVGHSVPRSGHLQIDGLVEVEIALTVLQRSKQIIFAGIPEIRICVIGPVRII